MKRLKGKIWSTQNKTKQSQTLNNLLDYQVQPKVGECSYLFKIPNKMNQHFAIEVSFYSFQKSKMLLMDWDSFSKFPIFYLYMREKSPLLLLDKLAHEKKINNSINNKY